MNSVWNTRNRGQTSPNICKNHKYGTTDWGKIRRQCQLVFDLLGDTCKICKLLSYFISCAILRVPLVAGSCSEGNGTTWRLWGYFHGGVFSLGLCGGVFVRFSASFTISGTCQIGRFESNISKFASKICNFRSLTAGRYRQTRSASVVIYCVLRTLQCS